MRGTKKAKVSSGKKKWTVQLICSFLFWCQGLLWFECCFTGWNFDTIFPPWLLYVEETLLTQWVNWPKVNSINLYHTNPAPQLQKKIYNLGLRFKKKGKKAGYSNRVEWVVQSNAIGFFTQTIDGMLCSMVVCEFCFLVFGGGGVLSIWNHLLPLPLEVDIWVERLLMKVKFMPYFVIDSGWML